LLLEPIITLVGRGTQLLGRLFLGSSVHGRELGVEAGAHEDRPDAAFTLRLRLRLRLRLASGLILTFVIRGWVRVSIRSRGQVLLVLCRCMHFFSLPSVVLRTGLLASIS
jgi:hypothetical protein